jgi:acetylornithine deacetylase/succinyl-diaminopimelate desuccinylase-like protein
MAQNVSPLVAGLLELLRFPSISAQPRHAQDVRRCAEWLAEHLRGVGLRGVEVGATRSHPIVYGEWLGRPGRPAVLIYGHYDVQPADPLGEWRTPPFEPTIRSENLYGRGASDDKGQLFVHVKAVESLLRSTGGLPVNVKFLFEGEEEIGSPNLSAFLEQNRKMLEADVAVVSDTRMLGPDQPAITYALRGSLGFELEVTGQQKDLHSGSFGGAVHNPLQGLCEILAKLHDPASRIAIPSFYDRVRTVARAEQSYMARHGPSDSAILASAGAPAGWGEPGFSSYERTTVRPAVTINGITGGYQGPGTKGVIPARASAKLNFRLVPDQEPAEIDQLFRRYISQITPSSLGVRVTTQKQARPVVVSLQHPAIRAASVAYQRGFGRWPVFLRSGGTIPVVDLFQRLLGIPTVLMGFALPDDGMHAPNEKLHLPTFFKGIATSVHFLEAMSHLKTELHEHSRSAAASEPYAMTQPMERLA